MAPTPTLAALVCVLLADRATHQPSPCTAEAYRRDFDAIAIVLAGGPLTPAAADRQRNLGPLPVRPVVLDNDTSL